MSVSGTPSNPEPTQPCSECFGTGKFDDRGIPTTGIAFSRCGACGGSGRATTKPAATPLGQLGRSGYVKVIPEAGGSPVPATPPAAERYPELAAFACTRGAGRDSAELQASWALAEIDTLVGRVAARDTLIQAACAWTDTRELDRFNPRRLGADNDLRAAVGVYRTGQTPEGNPT